MAENVTPRVVNMPEKPDVLLTVWNAATHLVLIAVIK